jgi:hypothetical protein
MMVARWSIDAKFGYSRTWKRCSAGCDIAPKSVSPERTRLTGSIGALEATVQSEHVIEDLAELNRAWDKLATIPAHQQWGKDLEPHVVSGTSRWEIYRLL